MTISKMLVHSRLSYRQNVDSTGGSGIIIRAVPLGFEAGADLVNKVAIFVDKPAYCDAAEMMLVATWPKFNRKG